MPGVELLHFIPESLTPCLQNPWPLCHDGHEQVPDEVGCNSLVSTMQPIDPKYHIVHTRHSEQRADSAAVFQNRLKKLIVAAGSASP
jgi:hypothetical protein